MDFIWLRHFDHHLNLYIGYLVRYRRAHLWQSNAGPQKKETQRGFKVHVFVITEKVPFPMDSSSSSSSSSTSSIHLAMAAFVGASLMAISAFYIHKRSVDQVLQRLIELRRNAEGRLTVEEEYGDEEEEDEVDENDDGGGFGSDGETVVSRKMGVVSRSVDDNFLRSYRMSSSLPNVAFGNTDWVDDDAKVDRLPNFRPKFSSSLDNIPSGLPPLRTHQRRGIQL